MGLKQSHESLCSKLTISYYCGELCLSNMVSKPCLNLVMSVESSNVEQRTPKEKGVEAPRRHSIK